MGKFDGTIKWFQTQMEHAAEALADLRGGQKIEINDKDVTSEWMARYERLIDDCKKYIGLYQKRNDE
jgi:hypothetical protein